MGQKRSIIHYCKQFLEKLCHGTSPFTSFIYLLIVWDYLWGIPQSGMFKTLVLLSPSFKQVLSNTTLSEGNSLSGRTRSNYRYRQWFHISVTYLAWPLATPISYLPLMYRKSKKKPTAPSYYNKARSSLAGRGHYNSRGVLPSKFGMRYHG